MSTYSSIYKVIAHLSDIGIEVKLNSNVYCFDRDEEIIYCAYNSDPIITLCSLLHEAGHALQSKSTFAELRSSIYRDKSIIAEQEYSAWREGLELANKLLITTPELETRYKKLWMKCWSNYLVHLYSDTGRLYAKSIIHSYID